MAGFRLRFLINELPQEDIDALNDDGIVIAKMLLTPNDYQLFHYNAGDRIEVQTANGYRLCCSIEHLEVLSGDERIILIFTLKRALLSVKSSVRA